MMIFAFTIYSLNLQVSYIQTTGKNSYDYEVTYHARLALALSIISTSANPAGSPRP